MTAARILIVDDSAVMRGLLRSVVLSDRRLEVAGTASDGESALRAMDSLRPDLVLLDVEMPVMDGLHTLRQMRSRGRMVPVIMCSALTRRGAKVTIEALASGAADYVAKPSGECSRETAVETLTHDLIPKILALTGPSAVAREYASDSALATFGPVPAVLVIGVSTGGPAALDVLLPALPANFPLPVLVVQHMPELFTRPLAERLNVRCRLHVLEAVNGQAIRRGNVYIARGDWHMEVVGGFADGEAFLSPMLRLTQDAPENHCRPSVDVLFRSAAAVYGSRVLAVMLTGMGSDGLAGSRVVREQHGTLLAQDATTSAVWGMPGAVAHAGLAQRVLPIGAMAAEILRLAARHQREAVELREAVV